MSQKLRLFSTVPVIRHSFATPITNIVANTQIATEHLRHTLLGEKSEIYLQRVLLNAHYLQTALKLAETNTSEVFSPKAALTELVALNEGTKLYQNLVSRIFIPQPCFLTGNRLLFQEMATCLLNNAYESYQLHHKKRYVFLSVLADTSMLTFTVTDGGTGMNWFSQKFSTLAFYSTKKQHTGLGLHFVKKTVEHEFEGKFLLRSQQGRGTTITLRIPIKRRQAIAKTSPGLNY